MNNMDEFNKEIRINSKNLAKDPDLQRIKNDLNKYILKYKYSYNFSWLGRPIIQYPQDIVAMQEIIWNVKPDLIIETGIAHGGSLIFYASMLELIGGDGQVLGIDIDIRKHNRKYIEEHIMSKRIRMIEGSSIEQSTIRQVCDFKKGKKCIMVVLDSMHTHEHVLKELNLYSPLVTNGSYMIVFDTVIEDFPKGSFPERLWNKGNNPKTAVWEFLKTNDRFMIDKDLENTLLLTTSPDGYLKCIA